MRHAAENGYSVNAWEQLHVCECGHDIRIRQIESLHVAIRNASAHETHDQFTGVMLILLDTWVFSSSVAWQRCEVVPNVIGPTSTTCERVVHHPAVVHYYLFCVFPSLIYNKCSLPALRHNYSLPPYLREPINLTTSNVHYIRFLFHCMGDYVHSQSITRQF